MCDGIAVNDGWAGLIRRLSEKLEPFCAATGVRASQVKEKGAALRIYLEPRGTLPDEIKDAIRDAVIASSVTCEGCGAVGQRRRLRWIRTLCDNYASFAAEYERRRFGDTPADEEWRAQYLRDDQGRRVPFEEAFRRWRRR